jgi:hypothetical protein
MPRIPLYNQGQGPTTRLATGQLSQRADVGAFTAPGRALAQFGEEAGQIAFNFGMAERDKQDTDTRLALSTKFDEDSNQYILKNPVDNIETFKKNFATWQKTWIDKNVSKDMSSRRKRLVLNDIIKDGSSKSIQGQKKAFKLGFSNSTSQMNQKINVLIDKYSNSVPESADYLKHKSDAEKLVEEAQRLGLPINYNKYTLSQALTKGSYQKESLSIDSEKKLLAYEDKLNKDKTLRFDERNNLITDGKNSFKDFQIKKVDTIVDSTISNNLSPKQIISIVDNLKKGGKTVNYEVGGEKFAIDVSSLDNNGINLLAENLTAEANGKAGANVREGRKSLNKFLIKNPSLSEVINVKNNIANGTGLYAGLSQSERESLSNYFDPKVNEIKRNVGKVIDQDKKVLFNSIKITGEIGESEKKLIKKIQGNIQASDESGVALKNFNTEITKITEGVDVYESFKYSSGSDIKKELERLSKEEREELDLNKQLTLSERNKLINTLFGNRSKALKERPYDYFSRELQKDTGTTPTRGQVYEAQIKAGLNPNEARFVSVEEENIFIQQFKGAATLNDKQDIYNSFINQKNEDGTDAFTAPEKQVLITNLRRRGTIDLVDNIFMSNPENLVNADLYNSKLENVTKAVKSLPKSERDDITSKVNTALAPYSASVLGQISTNYETAPGTSQPARVDHGLEMKNLIYDLAGFYYTSPGGLTISQAVTKAVDNVVNKNFNFETVGGGKGVVRLPNNLINEPRKYAAILDLSLKGNDDNVQIWNSLPITKPAGDINNQYVKELRERGQWLTKSDNSGVILVDQTGNPVVINKEIAPNKMGAAVIELSFDELDPLIDFYYTTGGKIRPLQIAIQNELKSRY